MRAIFYPYEKNEAIDCLSITGDSFKHLQVVRVKTGEEILVLNGKGLIANAVVGIVSKAHLELKILQLSEVQPKHKINLAIANPKKDAFEDIIKMAVELGVGQIYPLSSAYSQYDYAPSERLQKIIENALVQSNNGYLPVIHPQTELEEFLKTLKMPLYFFNSRPSAGKSSDFSSHGEELTVLIGPEGGFSPNEEEKIQKLPNVFSIHLPTPILRAPTAVASSIGYLLSISEKK